jgi:hypothetical protein
MALQMQSQNKEAIRERGRKRTVRNNASLLAPLPPRKRVDLSHKGRGGDRGLIDISS